MPSNDQIEHIEPAGPAAAVSSDPGNPVQAPGGPYPPAMIPVGQLAGHPGNVREDLSLGTEFCASVAETGVRIPLIVTPGPDGGLRVLEGHRRLAAAVKGGLTEVPCVLDPAHADDEAGQHWDGTTWTAAYLKFAALLRGIAAVGPHQIWAVGQRYGRTNPFGDTTLTLRFSGRTWSRIPSPNALSGNSTD
jgi:ParB-like nuclease family protein